MQGDVHGELDLQGFLIRNNRINYLKYSLIYNTNIQYPPFRL